MSEADISMPERGALDGIPLTTGVARSALSSDFAPPFTESRSENFVSVLRTVFSFPAMLATFLLGRVFYEARAFFVDPDLWWHIRIGQNILATHHWPTTDPFSYTVGGNPWMAYEWLGDVLLGAVARFGGLMGLELLLLVLA